MGERLSRRENWTAKGLVDLYVLYFIHPGSRKVFVSGITAHPDAGWMRQQARNATMTMADLGLPVSHLVIDHDTKYTQEFDAVLAAEDTTVVRVGPRAPNLNAFAERFAQALRTECLDHFVVVGEKHLRHLVSEFLTHYHHERPHQGIGNVPAVSEPRILKFPTGRVRGRTRLGGLLKHFFRAAA